MGVSTASRRTTTIERRGQDVGCWKNVTAVLVAACSLLVGAAQAEDGSADADVAPLWSFQLYSDIGHAASDNESANRDRCVGSAKVKGQPKRVLDVGGPGSGGLACIEAA